MDRASVIGILLGAAALIGGNLAEGGKLASILQPTAALIVVAGTLGATMLSYPIRDVFKAIRALREVFFAERTDPEFLVKEILRFSALSRRSGLIALEPELASVEHTFLRKAIRLAIDGMGPKILKDTMEQENITFEEEGRRTAKVYETAGGFAPTIGILGAVLGLIHVMENLSDPSKLGAGIAVAFVATIYGVGSANLLFLPIAKKLMHNLSFHLTIREMLVEGVVGIQSGINPHYLEERLRVYLGEKNRSRL